MTTITELRDMYPDLMQLHGMHRWRVMRDTFRLLYNEGCPIVEPADYKGRKFLKIS